MKKSDKLYGDSPSVKRGKDGDMEVTKPSKEGSVGEKPTQADGENMGLEGGGKEMPIQASHESERKSMHKRHEEEQHAMHERHSKDMSEMHKRHEKASKGSEEKTGENIKKIESEKKE